MSRELLPVCYTESYSRPIAPRATPGLLHRELLPVCYTESYSRSIAPRVTPGLLLFNKSRSVEKGVKAKFRQLFFVNNDRPCLTKKRPHTIPSRERGSQTLWLQRELLPVCYTESYSRSANWHGPNEPLLCFLPNRTAHCQLLEVSNASAPQAHKYWRTIGQFHPRLRHVMEHPHPCWKRPLHPHIQDHFRSQCTS